MNPPTIKYIFLVVLIASLELWGGEAVKGESLMFNVSEDVKFEFNDQPDFYTFTWGEDYEQSLFMLYKMPSSMPESAVKPMADMMFVTMEDQLKKDEDIELIGTHQEEIKIGIFSGWMLTFELKSNDEYKLNQSMYILYDGSAVWNGQLTNATKESIDKTNLIIEGAKPVE